MQQPSIFGMRPTPLSVQEVASRIMAHGPEGGDHPRLVVTPNIQHVSLMRRNSELEAAMRSADLITCDGFPVYRYARARGCDVSARVTGREVVAEMLHRQQVSADHRLFFVVDSEMTAGAVVRWAHGRGILAQVKAEVPPQSFDLDPTYCASLAGRVRGFGATILMMCVGAPKSELFVHRHRNKLPSCWALCVGQSVKLALALAPPPPALAERLNLEWLWRLALEPRRLLKRYLSSGIGFAAAVLEDLAIPEGRNAAVEAGTELA